MSDPPFTIHVDSALPLDDNKRKYIKVRLYYFRKVDDVDVQKRHTTDFMQIQENNFTIDIPKPISQIRWIDVYLIYGIETYRYQFDFTNLTNSVSIVITMGQYSPVVRVNKKQVMRRDQSCLCSLCMICFCCSVTEVLDDIERAERDYEAGLAGCIIQ